MDVDAYLERIGYRGGRRPTPETLRALHRAHLQTVPFENLDIRLGRPIELEREALFSKIVGQRRGGFCYELNGLFGALLEGLGFEVDLLSGRVWDGGRPGPEFDHMLLRVAADGSDHLADIGFGDSFREPPRLEEGEWSEADRRFRLARERDGWCLSQKEPQDDWKPQVSFSARPRDLGEFAPMCTHHQTSPDSSFVRRVVATRACADGRVTYSDGRLIETASSRRTERSIRDLDELESVLRERFGLVLGTDADLGKLLPRPG